VSDAACRRTALGPLTRESHVAVTSRSFSREPELREALRARHPLARFHASGEALCGEALLRFLEGSDAAIVGLERIDASLLERLPRLRAIAKYGVGLDALDLAALRDAGVRLGWTPGVNRRSVAELALCLALASLRHVVRACCEVREGGWKAPSGGLLSGRSVGIVGLGHVGGDFAELLAPFGCRLLGNDILDRSELCRARRIEQVSLDTLLEESDVVSLHVPLTPATRGLLDSARIARMKPGAVLLNTARGGIVDESALAAALACGRLGAAAFDVFADEPPQACALLSLPSFIATPHIGGSSREAVLAMGHAAIAALDTAVLPDPSWSFGA